MEEAWKLDEAWLCEQLLVYMWGGSPGRVTARPHHRSVATNQEGREASPPASHNRTKGRLFQAGSTPQIFLGQLTYKRRDRVVPTPPRFGREGDQT